ncbi:MAG: T9SS type A sorting domain-containing protein [Flavobacteriales bacterium]|nr:T9SS type A sorting domain-containing protein [Flavobacteriales bacterium]
MQNAERRPLAPCVSGHLPGLGSNTCPALAQHPDSIPSIHGDKGQGLSLIRKEQGQTFDTDGDHVDDLRYYFEQTPVGIHLMQKSKVSFTLAEVDNDTSTVDTLYRIDMSYAHSRSIDPVPIGEPVGHLTNYYRNSVSVEEVKAYAEVVYRSVWDSINVHFYKSAGGPRMAYVILPGGNPNDITLAFAGQDSIHVDWQGNLKLYLDGDWIELREALAYQVDANYDAVPLNWTADYLHTDGSVQVTFEFDTYNEQLPLVLEIGYPPMPMGGGADLGWSTLFGTATGTGYSEFITAGDADADGNLFVAGNTRDEEYPATVGLLTHAGNYDVFFGRLRYAPGDSENDAVLTWMSYYGGGGNDKPTVLHIAEYSDEHGFIAGWSSSEDLHILPSADPANGSFYQDSKQGSTDGFLFCFNPATGFVLRSTYFGGEGGEMFTAITEDVDGNILLAGATTSSTGTTGCTAGNGMRLCSTEANDYQQTSNAGGTDAFLVRIDVAFFLSWCTFYGGEGDDYIYDATYQIGTTNPLTHRIAFVGSTTDDVPFGATGNYQQTGTGSTNAFIMTIDADLAPKWGTNIHGVERLEAVIGRTAGLVVMGTTDEGAATTPTCGAVANTLSICDPGFGAYHDDVVASGRHDAYFAEFRPLSGSLNWSTAYGDQGWNGAHGIDDDLTPLFRYSNRQQQPFPIFRFSDLQVDAALNVYALGFFHHGYPGVIDDQSTVWAWGFYNQEWDSDVGQNQSDVSLYLFNQNNGLEWMSLFGGGFDHLSSPADPYGFDWVWQLKGSEFGHNLVLVPGEALYWVGTAGGVAFPEECPSPGTSWCESSLFAVGDNLDPMQGFITRMPLQGISIGVTEAELGAGAALACYPNPASDQLMITHAGRLLDGAKVQVLDALGRIVEELAMVKGAMDVSVLSSGAYCARVSVKSSELVGAVRFVIR